MFACTAGVGEDSLPRWRFVGGRLARRRDDDGLSYDDVEQKLMNEERFKALVSTREVAGWIYCSSAGLSNADM